MEENVNLLLRSSAYGPQKHWIQKWTMIFSFLILMKRILPNQSLSQYISNVAFKNSPKLMIRTRKCFGIQLQNSRNLNEFLLKMLFCAELTNVKPVYNMLKAITIKDFAIIRPMKEGLKVTIDEMKCMETSAYIPSSIFAMYHVDDSQDENLNMFKISLKTFTDILNIFGDDNNLSLKLSFKEIGSPLCLVLYHGEENITIDCEIKTLNINDLESPSLADECNLNKIVINASILVELLQRLDNLADEVKITFSPDPPNFTLKTLSLSGESDVNISKHSESVTIFKCQEKMESVYAFQNIRHIIKVMHHATKVAISTGESGLLGLQLVITSDEEKQMYVEYYVTSQYMDER